MLTWLFPALSKIRTFGPSDSQFTPTKRAANMSRLIPINQSKKKRMNFPIKERGKAQRMRDGPED